MRLVWPYTEELISRPFVGENRFWLVLQDRISTENAIGCLFFHQEKLFLPCTVYMHTASAAQWAFQMDLCWSRSRGFVRQTNPCDLLHHKSIWNAHWAAEAVCMCRAKKEVAPGGKTSSLQHSLCLYGSGALIRIDFHPQTAEKMAPPCIARPDLVNCNI